MSIRHTLSCLHHPVDASVDSLIQLTPTPCRTQTLPRGPLRENGLGVRAAGVGHEPTHSSPATGPEVRQLATAIDETLVSSIGW